MPLISRTRIIEVWRYYQAGAINTAFGFGSYSLLVWLGLNMFLAQILSHVAGTVFNYMIYSRHVFRESAPAKARFAISYGLNYLMGLAMLAAVSQFIASPYLAGLGAIIIVSIVNYFVLKLLVFRVNVA